MVIDTVNGNATIVNASPSDARRENEETSDLSFEDTTEPETDEDEEVSDDTHGVDKAFAAFEAEHKWTLPSGTIVEDVLYKAPKGKQEQELDENVLTCLRNWIIDVDSTEMAALFSSKDWTAIHRSMMPNPGVPAEFAEHLVRQFPPICTVETFNCAQC
jgi:hypothetical protein